MPKIKDAEHAGIIKAFYFLIKLVFLLAFFFVCGFFAAYEVAENRCEERAKDYDGYKFDFKNGCLIQDGDVWFSLTDIERKDFITTLGKERNQKNSAPLLGLESTAPLWAMYGVPKLLN